MESIKYGWLSLIPLSYNQLHSPIAIYAIIILPITNYNQSLCQPPYVHLLLGKSEHPPIALYLIKLKMSSCNRDWFLPFGWLCSMGDPLKHWFWCPWETSPMSFKATSHGCSIGLIPFLNPWATSNPLMPLHSQSYSQKYSSVTDPSKPDLTINLRLTSIWVWDSGKIQLWHELEQEDITIC